ncbi:MAG: hypothetical protein ACRD3E_09980 [Terriglobales bacterium]
MKLDRTFQFRGGRNYLHSTSVFDDLLGVRGEDVANIDLKFHRRTLQQVSYTDETVASAGLVAEWSDNRGKLCIVERDESMTERVPYDEDALVKMIEIDGRMARIPAETPSFTRIEALVAGFKHLLQTVYAGLERKYVFVRIRLEHCPVDTMEIHYARDIGAFFQGDISEGGKPVGQIFFGVW